MSVGALAFAVALLAANGFFVAAEFALLAARRQKLEGLAGEGDKRAISAIAGLRELSLMLAGAQLGITLASLGLGAIAEPAVAEGIEALLGLASVPEAARHAIAFAIALTIVVFLHMVVGEMAPKSWAIADPERSALALARPFRAFVLVLRPFIRLLNALANVVVRLCGAEPQDERASVHSASDLLLLVRESGKQGALDAEQHDMLARALHLSGLDAESAMVPRRDVVAVPAEAHIEELERLASRTGRSRLPVYEDGDLDRVLGVLHVKDLLRLEPERRQGTTARELARPTLVVPESAGLEDLMLQMREQGQHMAIVVDEYGSMTGLVALEDLLEELIGDFEDESDRPVRRLGRRPDGALVVPAGLRRHELRERADLDLPEGDYETVAGYVIATLGRLPDVGDTVEVDRRSLQVTRMDGPRVLELSLSPRADRTMPEPARGA